MRCCLLAPLKNIFDNMSNNATQVKGFKLATPMYAGCYQTHAQYFTVHVGKVERKKNLNTINFKNTI